MVSNWSCQNPLTLEERKLIKEGLDLGMSYSEIGIHTGRCKSVVLRESKRLGSIVNYNPIEAQKNFEDRQKSRRKKT
jgi:IS30 family transposase